MIWQNLIKLKAINNYFFLWVFVRRPQMGRGSHRPPLPAPALPRVEPSGASLRLRSRHPSDGRVGAQRHLLGRQRASGDTAVAVDGAATGRNAGWAVSDPGRLLSNVQGAELLQKKGERERGRQAERSIALIQFVKKSYDQI